jgi:hypothetical protein
MRKITLAMVAMVAMVAAGCSSGGDDAAETTTTTEASAEAQVWIDAFVSSFTTGDAEMGALVLPDDRATCVSERWVEAIGLDALEASDVTPEEASDPNSDLGELGADEEAAVAMVAAFDGCDVDLVAELATSLTASSENAEEDRACVEENLERDAVEDLLVALFQGETGDAEFEAILGVLQDACGDF